MEVSTEVPLVNDGKLMLSSLVDGAVDCCFAFALGVTGDGDSATSAEFIKRGCLCMAV